MLYHLNQSGVGLRHFFTLKIDSEVLGTKTEKSPYGALTLVWEKSPNGAFNCTKRTFLQTRNEPHLLKSTPSGPFSRPKIKHLWDFSLFLGPRLQSQFLGWKNAFTPHLIDSDGRTFHKDSEYGPNSKIMKNTKRTFLQTTAAGALSHERGVFQQKVIEVQSKFRGFARKTLCSRDAI